MKKIIFAMLLLLSSTMGIAQTQRVSRFEGGFYLLPTMPLGSFNGAERETGAGFGVDFRHNLKDSPWDCGLYAELNSAAWEMSPSGYAYRQSHRTFVVGVASHYNFKQGALVNPYAGLGLGYGYLTEHLSLTNLKQPHSLVVSPRFGVELLRHVRIGCQANITRKGFHSIGLNIGIAFGGGRRK